MSDGPTAEQTGADGPQTPGANVAEVPPGGPLCLTGRILVEVDGEIVADTDDVALCRCGHSSNKPFCDGSHNMVGFDDPGVILGGRLVPGPECRGRGRGRERRERSGRPRARADRLRDERAAAGAGSAYGGGVRWRDVAGHERGAVQVRGVVNQAVLRRISP